MVIMKINGCPFPHSECGVMQSHLMQVLRSELVLKRQRFFSNKVLQQDKARTRTVSLLVSALLIPFTATLYISKVLFYTCDN